MEKNYRCCISCRKIGHKSEFWRIVRCRETPVETSPSESGPSQSGPSKSSKANYQIQLDTGMGRSAYLCPTEDCLKTAQKKKRLGRALRAAVPEDVYATLSERLSQPLSHPGQSAGRG